MRKVENNNWSIAVLWLNLILSLFIVFLHTEFEGASLEMVGMYLKVKRFTSVIADTAVPSFFCVSGYLLFRKLDNTFLCLNNYLALIKNKVKGLIVPYLLWNVIGLLYKLLLSVVRHQSLNISVSSVLLGFFLSEWNQPLWFIRSLFILVLVSPIIYMICTKNRYLPWIVWGVMVIGYWWLKYPYSSFITWIPSYIIGAYFGINKKHWVESDKNKSTKAFLIIMLLFAIIVYVLQIAEDGGVYYFYRQTSCVLFIGGFLGISWKYKPTTIFQNSFFTFCSHILFLGLIKTVIFKAFCGSPVLITIGFFVCSLSVWATTIVAATILKNTTPHLYSLLTGGRKDR